MRRFSLPNLLPCVLGILLAAGALAQEDGPWIQVEVLLFRNLDEGAANGEQWPEHPELVYPSPLRPLIDPLALAQAHRAIEDAAWRALAEYPLPNFTPQNNIVRMSPDTGEPGAVDAATDNDDIVIELESPYVLLDEPDRVLADAYKRLRWSSQFRPLTHLAWRQPRVKRGRSVHIPLSGGAVTADHREVEGSLTIRQSAFMHVRPHLWLNNLGAVRPGGAYAYTRKDDVVLPPLPNQSPSDIDLSQLLLPYTARDIAARRNSDGSLVEDPLPRVKTSATPVPYSAVSELTVLLDEERRISQGEVNYFDHPLFGMILSITPYDPLAAAQARAAGAQAPATDEQDSAPAL